MKRVPPQMRSLMSEKNISVIGCGDMGAALARALSAAGHHVHVFDLDDSRVAAVATGGIYAADSTKDAFEQSELIVLSVPTYDNVGKVLESVDSLETWRSKTIVNLVTGTPQEASSCADVVHGNGAAYLDGIILAFPGIIGTEEAMVLFSGSNETWRPWSETLMALGGSSRHVSEEIGGANVLDAMTGVFLTVSLTALIEAMGYLRAQGMDVHGAKDAAKRIVDELETEVNQLSIEAVTAGKHKTDEATIDVWLDAAEGWYRTIESVGQRGSLLATTVDTLKRASDAGLGDKSIYASIDVL